MTHPCCYSARILASRMTFPHLAVPAFFVCVVNSSGVLPTGSKPNVASLLHIVFLHDLDDLAVDQVGDRLGRAGWHQHTLQRVGFLPGEFVFHHGRHMGQSQGAGLACDRQRAQLPALHQRRRRRQGHEPDRCMTRRHRLRRRPGAAERHVHQIKPRAESVAERAGDATSRAGAWSAKLYLPGLAFTRSTSSLTLFAGSCGLTISNTLGEVQNRLMGTKSRSGS